MSIGRVGNNQLTRKLLFQLEGQLKDQARIIEQLSSNKSILRPSDDPTGVGKAMGLRSQSSRLEEYTRSIQAGEVWTNITSTALDSAVSTWKRVNEVAISAADGTKTAEDRAGMAEELDQLLQHMVQIGNTSQGGRYIFGGGKTGQAAFNFEKDAATGRITGVFYQGDSQLRNIKTQDNAEVPLNILGSNAGDPDRQGSFVDTTSGVDVFKTLISIRDKLLNNDTIGLSGAGGLIEDVEHAAKNLTSAQVRLGGSQEWLALDRNRTIEQNANVERFLGEIEDADSAELILELNNLQNVYEAALASGSRLLQGGLLRFI